MKFQLWSEHRAKSSLAMLDCWICVCKQFLKYFVPVLPPPPPSSQGELQGAGDAKLEQGKGWLGPEGVPSGELGAPAAGASQASAQAASANSCAICQILPFCHISTGRLPLP